MARIIDTLIALAVLATLGPVLLAIGLAVALESPGGPLYFAPRAGKGGRQFRMWKFRTMIAGAAAIGPPVTGKNDRRVTRLGKFLRRTKLDELPQFVNVLKGDMTLVGPRPEAPEIVRLYTAEQRAILAVKPGLTGRGQLESAQESENIPEDVQAAEYYVHNLLDCKIRRDLEYLNTRTTLGDAQIVLATVVTVVRSLVAS